MHIHDLHSCHVSAASYLPHLDKDMHSPNIKVNSINLHCLTKAIAEREAPQLILHQPIAVYRWVLRSMVCRRCCPPTTTSLMCCLTASWTRSQNRSWCGCVGASCQILPYTLTIGALPCSLGPLCSFTSCPSLLFALPSPGLKFALPCCEACLAPDCTLPLPHLPDLPSTVAC